MKRIKLSTLVLSFSLGFFSLSIIAADNTKNLSDIDGMSDTNKDLNRPLASDTVKLRDCSSRSGNDKMLCEKANKSGKANAMSKDSRNNTLRDDLRSRELNNRDLNDRGLNNRNPNNNSRNTFSRDNQSRESYPSDTGSSATQPNGSNSMNSTTGEMRPNAPSNVNPRGN